MGNLIVTARLDADPCQYVKFTWDEDLQGCEFEALGPVANDEVDALVAARVHEGGRRFAGWTITVS